MKKIGLFVLLILVLACQQNTKTDKNTVKQNTMSEANNAVDANTIQVLYFHSSIRCTTCVSVDSDTHKYLSELFPDEMKQGKIIFKSLNIDKNEREDLIQKFEIYGQRLLFIKGDKVLDKTDDAFEYVTTQPDKWRKIVKSSIEALK